jgi:tetratricopeptide (TPR) repeat protein
MTTDLPAQYATALQTDPLTWGESPLRAAVVPPQTTQLSTDPLVHQGLAQTRQAQGDALGAAAHQVASAVLSENHGTPERRALPLYNVATGYLMTGDYRTALDWYRLALAIDPELVIAHQNLAAVCQRLGLYAEAEQHRKAAYRRQRAFIEPCPEATRRVLVLCTGQEGNIPFEALLPATRTHRIKYFLDYAQPEEDETLPPYDLVFNAIGEPDIAAHLYERLNAFAATCKVPLLNSAATVLRGARHRLPDHLAGLSDVITPPCVRLDLSANGSRGLASLLEKAGLEGPVLSRPVATHGGEGVVRHADLGTLEASLSDRSGAHYFTRFIDTRSPDGFYRKYRMIFIGGRSYPYHCAISQEWLVHYFSADMLANPWKLDEERRFLEEPGAALGARALTAVEAVGKRLGFDYGGIDFAVLADGRIMVFEANATMLVHFERPEGPLGHKNRFVSRIVEAFDTLQTRALQGFGS